MGFKPIACLQSPCSNHDLMPHCTYSKPWRDLYVLLRCGWFMHIDKSPPGIFDNLPQMSTCVLFVCGLHFHIAELFLFLSIFLQHYIKKKASFGPNISVIYCCITLYSKVQWLKTLTTIIFDDFVGGFWVVFFHLRSLMQLRLAGGSGFWVGCLSSPPHTLSSSKKLPAWCGGLRALRG